MKKIRKTKVKDNEFNKLFGITEYFIHDKYWKIGTIFYFDFGHDKDKIHIFTLLKITHDRRVPNDSFICDMFTNVETNKEREAKFFKDKTYSPDDFLLEHHGTVFLMSEEEYVLFLLQRGLSEHDHKANEGS